MSSNIYTDVFETISPDFWEIMANASGDSEQLRLLLVRKTAEEISMFHYEYETLIVFLRDDIKEILELDYNSAKELAGWVISQGKTFFKQMDDSPDELKSLKDVEYDRKLINVAIRVYWSKFDNFLPVPEGGYWSFKRHPWSQDTKLRQKLEGDFLEDILIHYKFLDRLNSKLK